MTEAEKLRINSILQQTLKDVLNKGVDNSVLNLISNCQSKFKSS